LLRDLAPNTKRKTPNAHTSTPSTPTLPRPESHLQHRPIRVVVFHPIGKHLQPLLDRRLRRPVQKRLRLRNVRALTERICDSRGRRREASAACSEVLLGCLGAHSESTSSLARHSCLRQGAAQDYFLTPFGAQPKTTSSFHSGRWRGPHPRQLSGYFFAALRALRGGVRGDRCVHRDVFGERHLVVVAVDRRGRAVDEWVDVDPSQMGVVRGFIRSPDSRTESTAIECALLAR